MAGLRPVLSLRAREPEAGGPSHHPGGEARLWAPKPKVFTQVFI